MASSWVVKSVTLGLVTLSLLGCSAQQAQSLGMRSSTVQQVPQRMTNLELCETYAYGRSAKHSRVAIASEWNRRGLSHKYCDKIRKELYITTAVKKLANAEERPASKQAKPVQPVN
ncbi:hypothetical protein MD588_18835 [Photobacterium sp. SDRW27]|uniref:hypothetical protein n=1 Tax=Photobacterium obscurum TaxID=2829490 RepID=UPI002243BED7|nr:hypothetical protein [Photobacterium obscurum]MCW8330852.1 hypothetical protein [Photobacterium obscurum]